MKKHVAFLGILLSLSALAQPVELRSGKGVFRYDGAAAATLTSNGTTLNFANLWRVKFFDTPAVDAGQFLKEPWNGSVTTIKEDNKATARFRSEKLDLDVVATAENDCIDLRMVLRKVPCETHSVELPTDATFPLANLTKVLFPHSGARNNGLAFLPDFFRKHTKDTPLAPTHSGERGYVTMFGDEPHRLTDSIRPEPVWTTAEGKKWFSKNYLEKLQDASATVNRPPKSGRYDVALLEGKSGPFLTGSQFGGKGWLFSFGGTRSNDFTASEKFISNAVMATLESLVARNPSAFKDKFVAVALLKNAPESGGWAPVRPGVWLGTFYQAEFLKKAGARIIMLTSFQAVKDALKDDRFAVILNPYGETFPSESRESLLQDLNTLKSFVQKGGIWWETGGFPFFYFLAPKQFCSTESLYPGGNSDFFQLRYKSHNVTMFGIQPLPRKPFDSERYCSPARLTLAGIGDAGTFSHGWFVACKNDALPWQSPPLRFQFNLGSPRESLEEYARINEIHVTLDKKLKKFGTYDTMRRAVLVRLSVPNAAEQIAELDNLPYGSLVHYTEYLKGGFDKQYPDHLPPNPRWGTLQDFVTFIDRGHQLGHLMMPYTNTSWWCTEPDGPTFQKVGTDPIHRNRDGSLRMESYGDNPPNRGYSLSFFHPEVQKACRVVSRQMGIQYKQDLILQDQVGSRSWIFNWNPCEPNPTVGLEAMRALSMEDAEFVPIACEDGHDRMLNFESMICGASWGLIPVYGRHQERHAKYHFPENEWQFFPMLSYLGHDKVIFTNHDLGHFIGNPEQLASAIAFGYSTSLNWTKGYHKDTKRRNWLFWLDALQKTAIGDYNGRKLLDYAYVEEGTDRQTPHSLIYSHYDGDVVVISNISDTVRPLAGLLAKTAFSDADKKWLEAQSLPPYGFYIASPTSRAGRMFAADKRIAQFAIGYDNGTVKGKLIGDIDSPLTVQVPAPKNWKDIATPTATLKNGWLMLNNPAPRKSERPQHPPQLLNTSPKQLLGGKATIAVFKPTPYDHPTVHGYADFLKENLKQFMGTDDFNFVELTTFDQLFDALGRQFSAERPFAIVSPSREAVLAPAGMTFDDLSKRILAYVQNGGIWWETGGCPFHYFRNVNPDGTYKQSFLGLAGLSPFRLTMGLDGYHAPNEPLEVTETGKRWFDKERIERICTTLANTKRAFHSTPGSITLVSGTSSNDSFVSMHRCGGWGFFANMGGMRYPDILTADVVAGALLYLWNNPWPAVVDAQDEIMIDMAKP